MCRCPCRGRRCGSHRLLLLLLVLVQDSLEGVAHGIDGGVHLVRRARCRSLSTGWARVCSRVSGSAILPTLPVLPGRPTLRVAAARGTRRGGSRGPCLAVLPVLPVRPTTPIAGACSTRGGGSRSTRLAILPVLPIHGREGLHVELARCTRGPCNAVL